MLLIRMKLFVTVRKKIKEMMNESALKGVGNLFLLLGEERAIKKVNK